MRRREFPKLVSVIIPVRDGAKTLSAQLAALSKQSYDRAWEVVVADDGSVDATRDVCLVWADRLPSFLLVDVATQLGPAHARNVGAAAAQGELLAFCDADDVVDHQWLETLVSTALCFDLVGGVQDAMRLNSETVRGSRGERTKRSLGRPLGFLPFAPTNNLAVWRDVFRTLDGMDPSYRVSEDIEFSWRAQLGGYQLGHAAESVVHYRYRTTTRSVARQAFGGGQAAARLYRDFRHAGARRPRAATTLRRWLAALLRVPLLVVPDQRLATVRLIANNVGRVVGSIRFRVLFL